MQDKELIIVGIDVSKKTLDICVQKGKDQTSSVITNQPKSITLFIKDLLKQYDKDLLLIGFENTGIYNYSLYDILRGTEIKTFVFHPLDLLRSMGMLRGKNDKTDAKRIALYLQLHHSFLSPSVIPTKNLLVLKALFTKRHRLVEHRAALVKSNKEIEAVLGKRQAMLIVSSDKKVIDALNQAIKTLEERIHKLLHEQESVARQMENITSVQGVGPVLASYLAIKTNGFTMLTNPRKLACYAGVVPFENQSGTSLKKNPRVSMMADKELKRLLHLAALRVIQLPGDLRDYYIRKVKEGKNKMSVLNAIRNKLIARICSCINNNKKYQINLQVS